MRPIGGADKRACMNWYALRVRSRFEIEAMQVVCSRGFQAFSPVRHFSYRPSGKGPRQLRSVSICPGYLFAKLPHGYAARGCPLVYGVVGVNGEPSVVPEQDVALLQVASGRDDRVARMLRQMDAQQLLRHVHGHD
jgi:hypothetical protein